MLSKRKNSRLFALGGLMYGFIEILWRGKTHWSMLLAGGSCFLSLYKLFEKLPNLPMFANCIFGSALITSIEFISGLVLNIKLKLKVWDYSNNLFNYKGQICLLYSVLWGLLCIPASKICKRLRG